MKAEIYWNAVINNDARFDGAFVYGVDSTRIYCKPSCSARQPKPENVRFFPSVETAEAKGFRACLRCRPSSEKANPQTAGVLRACEILETEEQITLEELSAELDLSPAHLQKVFKEIVGVSPKKFAEISRLEKFKKELKNGSDVTEAIYESGFGSSSRLYENVSQKLGMTPAVYKSGGRGVKIDFTIAECELGKLLVARTQKGICSVTFGDDENVLAENLKKEFPNAEIRRDEANLKDFVEAILGNLKGTNKTLDLPLDLQATAFQMRVWETLRKIPYGKTASYREIAETLGNKNAVRAVARACASNPVALVVPCHRIVRSSGELSGYRWGVERKKKLLEKEKKQ
ncbi:MAG TPA: bifunctional DNA-binding transcriptional regulator/O6-methylguanine-DNA methyltransferase Ada [Pyrinomonadaceae bacterium]|nr:bifunctional DNA-binding transcriptional regulator/O6-methylguanine-DNA methyltransferase Ada [Pyrinomonadaceae bacterium]